MYENNRNRKPLQLQLSKPAQPSSPMLASKKSQYARAPDPTQSYIASPSQPSELMNQSFIDIPVTHNNINDQYQNNSIKSSSNNNNNNNNNKYGKHEDYGMNSPSEVSSEGDKVSGEGELGVGDKQQLKQLRAEFETIVSHIQSGGHTGNRQYNNSNMNRSRSIKRGINKHKNTPNTNPNNSNSNSNSDEHGNDMSNAASGLYRIYLRCMDKNINFNNVQQSKKYQRSAKNHQNEESEGAQWITLLINVTLNLWKILNQHKCNTGLNSALKTNKHVKHMSTLKIIGKSCTKIMMILDIDDSSNTVNSQWGYGSLLMNQIYKNRLVLLLIIWAQEELDTGNKEGSLRICNICSFQLIPALSRDKSKFAISQQNKFKLHYLRSKIFRDLNKQKQQIQQIIICEELLKNMNMNVNKNKNNTTFMQLSEQKQNRNNSIDKLNKNNFALKLHNRKQQLLNNQKLSRLSSPTINSKLDQQTNIKINRKMESELLKQSGELTKFKQIRDSLLMSNIDGEFSSTVPIQSFAVKKSQCLKRVQSLHDYNGNKKVNFRNSNQLPFIQPIEEPDQQNLMMKSTVKQKFRSLHHNSQQKYSNTNSNSNTINNKFGNKSRLKIAQTTKNTQVRSVSAYKTIQLKVQDKNKIKQKYDLKPKKLAKRPIIAASKNNEFDMALQYLDEDCAMQQNSLQQFKRNSNVGISSYLQSTHLSPTSTPLSNYMELMIKRPQVKSSNKKYENSSNNAGSILTNHNLKSNQNGQQLQSSANKSKNNIFQISDKIIQDCVDKVQKQIIQKYITRINNIKKKAVQLDNRDIDDFRSEQQMEGEDSEGGLFQSQSNQTIIAQSAMKIKQISDYSQKQLQYKLQYNKIQQQYLVQQSDVYNNQIPYILFPGLGLSSIRINIKKVKQFNPGEMGLINLQRKQKLSCIMSLSIKSYFGSFLSVHRIPEYFTPSNMTIVDSINAMMEGESWAIRVGNSISNQIDSDDLENQKIVGYIKKNMSLVNHGLGLKLEAKKSKQDPMKSSQPKPFFPEYQSIIALSRVSRIYLQNKSTIQSLFSGECKQTIHRGHITDIFKSIADSKHAHDYKNNLMQTLKENKAQKSSKNFNIMDTLAVIYITIQKKSKNQNKIKKAKSNKLIKKVESVQKLHLSSDGSQSKQITNQQQQSKQHKVGFKSIQNQPKQKIQDNDSQLKKLSQNELSNSIDTLLIPVIKYVLMGQTSKPKHKLKTIIVKANQNRDGMQLSEDQIEQQRNYRNRCKSQVTKKYGLLTPYIDDKLTVKTKSISTGIYGQIIGEYFMNARNKQQTHISKSVSIPQDVMLSLKYYLMISNKPNSHNSNTLPLQLQLQLGISKGKHEEQVRDDTISTSTACSLLQAQARMNKINDVMDKFYHCFQYQFVIKLHNQNIHQKSNNYQIKIKIYWTKELYRTGLQKFYILQFEVKQRSARSRVDKFVLTSYDIGKHFTDLVFDPNSNGRSIKNSEQSRTEVEAMPRKQNREVREINRNYPKTARTLKNLQPLSCLQSQRKRSSRKDLSKPDESASSHENNLHMKNKEENIEYNDENSIEEPNMNRFVNNFQLLAPGIEQKQARSEALSDAKSESQARVQSEIHLDHHYETDDNVYLKLLNKNANILNINDNIPNNNSLCLDEKTSNIKIFSASNKDVIQEYTEKSQIQNEQCSGNLFLSTDPLYNREKDIIGANNVLLSASGVNRLSCPEKQFKQRLEFNRNRKLFEIQNPLQSGKSLNNSILLQDPHSINKDQQPRPCQTSSLIAIDTQINFVTGPNKLASNTDEFNKNNKFYVKLPLNHLSCFKPGHSQQRKDESSPKLSVSQFLKAIAQRMTIYKTKIYTKLGLRAEQTSKQIREEQQKTYYANKFRFSRSNNDRLFAQQFLTPHLNNLQILFQKIIKIKCDDLYVIMTVVKVEGCDQFYINMYVSQMQKNLLFTITCEVFQYFNKEVLVQIFDPYLSLTQLSIEQTNQKIRQLFMKPINNSNQCNRNSMKLIWSRILKHLTFERRPFSKWNKNVNCQPQAMLRDSYLIAKLGTYEAFVKNFVVDDFIQVKNQIRASQHCSYQEDSTVRVQVSMEPKHSGLNFSTPKFKTSKRSQVRSSQKSSNSHASFNVPLPQSQSLNIYQSQTNKYMVYVTISSTSAPGQSRHSNPQSSSENHQKICYSYYLCELLHLIDYGKARNQDNHKNNDQQMKANVDNVYHTESKQFREIILNYAVLFKVLNYIKNQYIIELQNQTTYLPKLYKDTKVKQLLKKNVNKILLRKDRKSSIQQQVNSNNSQSDVNKVGNEDLTRNLLLDLLSMSLKPSTAKENKTSASEANFDKDICKHSSKITFNSKITSQSPSSICFLLRKVVSRKGYPISCLFFDQHRNCLRLYLSDYRRARVRQITMPVQSHSMLYIDVIMNAYEGYRQANEPSLRDQYQDNNAYTSNGLLFFRNRLRKFYRNITLLTHI